jgi:hypothetical protein
LEHPQKEGEKTMSRNSLLKGLESRESAPPRRKGLTVVAEEVGVLTTLENDAPNETVEPNQEPTETTGEWGAEPEPELEVGPAQKPSPELAPTAETPQQIDTESLFRPRRRQQGNTTRISIACPQHLITRIDTASAQWATSHGGPYLRGINRNALLEAATTAASTNPNPQRAHEIDATAGHKSTLQGTIPTDTYEALMRTWWAEETKPQTHGPLIIAALEQILDSLESATRNTKGAL